MIDVIGDVQGSHEEELQFQLLIEDFLSKGIKLFMLNCDQIQTLANNGLGMLLNVLSFVGSKRGRAAMVDNWTETYHSDEKPPSIIAKLSYSSETEALAALRNWKSEL